MFEVQKTLKIMSANQKDKRTKEQILKLLDNAIEQEERLSEKIKLLETELADCRKKAEDPRAELTDDALPSSKVSFRLDYYRTAKNGPLKGIIEHLPSRETKVFEGEGRDAISQFLSRFVSEEAGNGKKKKAATAQKSEEIPLVAKVEIKSSTTEAVPEEVEQLHETATTIEMVEEPLEMVVVKVEEKTETEPVTSQKTTPVSQPVIVAEPSQEKQSLLQPAAEKRSSRLLERLKAKINDEIVFVDLNQSGQASTESSVRSERVQRLLERSAREGGFVQRGHKGQDEAQKSQASHLSLIERLRQEYKNEQSAN